MKKKLTFPMGRSSTLIGQTDIIVAIQFWEGQMGNNLLILLKHGWISKALHGVRARFKRSNTTRVHLHDMAEKGKTAVTRERSAVARG